MGKLLNMYGVEAAIATATQNETETFSELAAGIDNITEALNEVIQQYFFMEDKGFASNEVTGMAPAITMTGRRVIGDAAQDFIFGKKYTLGSDRKSKFKISYFNQTDKKVTLECDVTICNIQEWSGASTDHSAISFEIRFNGKPTATTAA